MIRLTLPWPPTVNTYWRHISKGPLAGRTLISEKGRGYRIAVGQACCVQLRAWAALTERLSVRIEAHAPDLRKRDLDNLPKGILDSLSEARVWQDDSQIDRLVIERKEVRKEGCVIVTIEVADSSNPELFKVAA